MQPFDQPDTRHITMCHYLFSKIQNYYYLDTHRQGGKTSAMTLEKQFSLPINLRSMVAQKCQRNTKATTQTDVYLRRYVLL